MSRHRPGRAYGHGLRRFCDDDYQMSWTVDRYYTGSRLRFPTRYTRDTDEKGARRFAKRHGCVFPCPPGGF